MMMKITLTTIAALILSLTTQAQDLIVTTKNDSINCKVTKIKADHIYFTYVHKGEVRHTLMPLSQVRHRQNDYYATSVIPLDAKAIHKYTKFRIAVHGGYSQMVAKTASSVPNNLKSYIDELKSGSHFGAEASYFFSESWGAGLNFSLFNTSNVSNSLMRSDDLSVTFIGPNVSTRYSSPNEKHTFLLGLALGYLGYHNNVVETSSYKLTGSTFGSTLAFMYDLRLSKSLALGAQFSYIAGSLTSLTASNGTTSITHKLEKEEYESLNRIDLSLGLRFRL
ncbi:outer membrane beta-barrel protein [Pedobacter sp. ASV28]|uniref:outer membrane beta-barrel protein n=1 Tax=Pedobacter sp. ASV28 TaxID=2795123 RepID=UPI0018EC5280|nr:outer membrane beta-barrel protein [Pedobacter sp. ASV28]